MIGSIERKSIVMQWFFSDKKEIEINTDKAISFNGDHF